MSTLFDHLDRHWNCRLTTTGRKSGEPRRVTIWYAIEGNRLFVSGGKYGPHWCRNLKANPDVVAEIGGVRLRGRARVVEEGPEARAIRDRFPRKYLLVRVARPFGMYTDSIAVAIEDLREDAG